MYFSFRGERKVPKESPLKESTRVLSLRILSPVRRALLPGGKRALCAVTSRVAGGPQPRRSAELAGLACSRGCEANFLFLLRVSGVFHTDGAPPFVRAIGHPRPSAHSDPFAPLWAKGSRAQVVGSVREAPWGLPCVALFWYFSFATERKVHVSIFPINPNLCDRALLAFFKKAIEKILVFCYNRGVKRIPCSTLPPKGDFL